MTDTSSPGMFSDPDAAIDRVQQQIVQAQETAKRAEQMRGEMDAVRGRAESPRGEVTATVEVTGRLSALDLTEAAQQLEPQELSRLILATITEAQRKAGAAALQLAADTFGEESGVTASLRGELDRMTAPAPGSTSIGY